MREITEFASAYVEQRDPTVSIDVDDILGGERNKWLPNIRVIVGADYSRFAASTRQRRDSAGASVNELMENWRAQGLRSEEHTSELQSLMRISYAVFCLKKKKKRKKRKK